MITKCSFCSNEFYIRPSWFARGRGKFCSRACVSAYGDSLKQKNTRCCWCSTMFYKIPSRVSKTGLYFCCRKCKDSAQSLGGLGELQPSHYGTGYKAKAWANLPHRCNRCCYDEHTGILEVHHVDHNSENNSLSNLELLCPNCHTIEHLVIHQSYGDKDHGDHRLLQS